MRLVSYERNGSPGVGIKTERGVVPTGYTDIIALIRDGEAGLRQAAEAGGNAEPIADYRLLAPVPFPGKVLCAGINYRSHKDENPKAVFPQTPSFFSKLPTAVIGSGDAIVLPDPDCQADYEVEIALVIGKTMKRVSREHALDYVFGYTVVNDVSGRNLQFRLQHETIGKGIDTFCPMGPEVVLTDEIPDPSNLRMTSTVNGERRQSSSTADMIFSIPVLLEFLTAYVTLHPGDVISTGTPAGVGTFRNPPLYLKPGDEVEAAVEGIGALRNGVVAGW